MPDDYSQNPFTTGVVNVNGPATTGLLEVAGDHDWFRIVLTAGVSYQFRLTGGTLPDPFLFLYNSGGLPVAADDDSGGGPLGLNSLITFTAQTSGPYYLSAEAYNNFYTGSYSLTATAADDFAASTGTQGRVYVNSAATNGRLEVLTDHDWFAITLVSGVSYQFHLNGGLGAGQLPDPLLTLRNSAGSAITSNDDTSDTNYNSLINYTATATGTYFLDAQAFNNQYTGAYSVSAQVGDDFSATTGTAGQVAVGGSSTGRVESAGDQDWFRVLLTAGHAYTINLRGSPSGNGTLPDPYFRGIYDGAGNLLPATANDDYGGTLESRIVFTPLTTGNYYLSAGGYYNAIGTYRLQVTENAAVADIANNTSTAATIAVNGTVGSTIAPSGDVDWFRVTIAQAGRYVIEENANFGTGSPPLFDPYFRGVYNAAGTFIPGTSNDDYGLTLDSRVSFNATPGTYYLAAGGFGTSMGAYMLRLNQVAGIVDALASNTGTTGALAVGGTLNSSVDYARDVDWIRVTLTAGQDYAIEVRGAPSHNGTLANPSLIGIYNASGAIISGTGVDDGPGTLESVSAFRPSATGTYYLAVGADDDGIGTYRVNLQTLANNLDIPANATTTARVQVGGSLSSQVDTPGDMDWIRVALTAGVTYQIQERGAPSGDGSLSDPRIFGIYNTAGQVIPGSGNDDSGGTLNSLVTFTAPTTGDFFIAAGAYANLTGSYRVTVGTAGQAATDNAAPLLQSTTPNDNATGVLPAGSLSLVFNEAVRAGTGNIVITGGANPLTIAVTDTQHVRFSGEVMTINPASSLSPNTAYSVTMGAGVVRDIAGNDFAGIASNTQFNFTTGAANATDSWTLMVYMAADNNLEGAAIADLNEMESATLPANVNVVVLVDRAAGYDSSNGNWTDTRWGAITHDNNLSTISSNLVTVGTAERNTGNGATLTEFINWAASNHPASRYGLVIWDHGGGLSGSSWDDASASDNLRMAEMRTAVDNSTVAHFDMIGFDACLMGMVEQAWDLNTLANVMVASQEVEPGDGWEYDRFLPLLAADPNMTATNLATNIVTTYGQRYAGESDITLSAIRMAAVPALRTAIDNFVAAVGPAPSAQILTGLRTAADHAQQLYVNSLHYRDLGDFMDEVITNVNSVAIDAAALAVANAVDSAVIHRAGTVADANGLSIYLPFGTDTIDGSYTPANQSFLATSTWDNFLALI